MILCSAYRVQRLPSIGNSFEGITRVFKELSTTKPIMLCSVREMRENRRFIKNKSLFFRETHIFLCSACRVQQTLSNEASSEWITRVFKEFSSIKHKKSCSVGEMGENLRFFENNSLFLTDTYVLVFCLKSSTNSI